MNATSSKGNSPALPPQKALLDPGSGTPVQLSCYRTGPSYRSGNHSIWKLLLVRARLGAKVAN